MINKQEIENSKQAILLEQNGSKSLLVSFGGIMQGMGIPVFEFFNSIRDLECDKMFIRDFNQAWYQKGLNEEIKTVYDLKSYLKNFIDRGDYDKVVFIGNSMGAYASILFGCVLNVNSVIAFAPQTYIDPIRRFIFRDRRWKSEMKRIHDNVNKQKEFFNLKAYLNGLDAYNTQVHIYYSSKLSLDKRHAERLSSIPNILLHPVFQGGHGIVKEIRDSGELKKIINKSFMA